MPRRFALRARYVFPVAETPVADGCVVVEDDRIVFVGESNSLRRDDIEDVFDLGNVAILPGLANTHAHLEFSDLAAPLGNRGIGFVDWIRMVIGHRRLTTVSPEEAIVAGLNESLRHGVTTVADIVQPDQSPVDSPLDVIQFLELKSFTTDGVACAMEQAKFHVVGGDSCRRCGGSRLHNRLRESPPTTVCLAGLCPHAPHTVHPELLAAVVELSATKQVPVAMHLAESAEEMEFLREGRGPFRDLLENIGIEGGTLTDHHTRPLDYLRQLAGAHRSLVIHGNYLDDEEIAFLGENASRMSAVYCPRSHDWFGHADYPLRKMLSAGATVALGTDGRCSTPDLSLLEEMRFAARRHSDVGLDEILRMGTLGGASALGRDGEIGSLTPGKLADMAIVALPGREADDPHDLIFNSSEPVVGCYCRGLVQTQ